MMCKWVILLVALAALSCVDGQRRGGGRGNRQPSGGSAKIPGMPRGAQVIATWSRALVDPSRTVQEGAFSVGANQIIVVSKDRGLSRDNYAKSLTIYDFTGNSMKTAMKVKSLKNCLVLTNQPGDKTRTALAAEIGAVNGTVVGATAPVTIYAVTMSDSDERALRTARPELASKCGKKKMMLGETTEPAGFSSSTTLLTTTFGQQLSIKAPGRQQPGGGRRAGGKKKKGRNQRGSA
ncbi:hypothetical protein C0Q70_06801 [Pomacea canaliculata]|uniref:Uncharacterized protein n=1 Tax=Pomacea canaliculata TaxID=400727 RepID=A0A2T7PDA4_POMCA|nr:uncharacterized protein LOC112561269 [Pomacea canaliculata]PVD31389.1 hypothetical protein C0Q70_06801 [Pomacea canaliculata]